MRTSYKTGVHVHSKVIAPSNANRSGYEYNTNAKLLLVVTHHAVCNEKIKQKREKRRKERRKHISTVRLRVG